MDQNDFIESGTSIVPTLLTLVILGLMGVAVIFLGESSVKPDPCEQYMESLDDSN